MIRYRAFLLTGAGRRVKIASLDWGAGLWVSPASWSLSSYLPQPSSLNRRMGATTL